MKLSKRIYYSIYESLLQTSQEERTKQVYRERFTEKGLPRKVYRVAT